jgi:hypothetical protein
MRKYQGTPSHHTPKQTQHYGYANKHIDRNKVLSSTLVRERTSPLVGEVSAN